MDRSQKPGDNWFLYCNGDWIKRTEIPPDRAGMGVFAELRDATDKQTASIVEERSQEQRAGRFEPAQDCRSLQLLHGRGGH